MASDWEPRFHLPAWVVNLPELSILSDLVLETVLFIFVHKAPVLPTGGKIEGLRKEDEEGRPNVDWDRGSEKYQVREARI